MSDRPVSSQEYWHAFVSRSLVTFLQKLSVRDIRQATDPLIERQEDIAKMAPKDANKVLREYISEEAVKQFSARYRADKYRKSKQKKTVQLEENTHRRLLAFKALLNADTVDEVLEYALSKKYDNDYDIIAAKTSLGETISDKANFNVDSLLMRMTLNDKYTLYRIVSSVYRDAWEMRKKTRSDKPDIIRERMLQHRFLVSLMKDEALLKEIELNDES